MPQVHAVNPSSQVLLAKTSLQKPTTQLGKEIAAKAESLSKTDAYVRSTINTLEHAVLGGYNSYTNTKIAMDNMSNGRVVTDYTQVLGSVKRAAVQRSITSGVRNTWSLIRGKATWQQAAGRVVGDVAESAVSSGVGSIATNVAIWGLAKAGASSFPVMLGGMAAGWAADHYAGKAFVSVGGQQALTDKTTELLNRIGN